LGKKKKLTLLTIKAVDHLGGIWIGGRRSDVKNANAKMGRKVPACAHGFSKEKQKGRELENLGFGKKSWEKFRLVGSLGWNQKLRGNRRRTVGYVWVAISRSSHYGSFGLSYK